jgi:hypothetical protein
VYRALADYYVVEGLNPLCDLFRKLRLGGKSEFGFHSFGLIQYIVPKHI